MTIPCNLIKLYRSQKLKAQVLFSIKFVKQKFTSDLNSKSDKQKKKKKKKERKKIPMSKK